MQFTHYHSALPQVTLTSSEATGTWLFYASQSKSELWTFNYHWYQVWMAKTLQGTNRWCPSHQAQVPSNCWLTQCLFLDFVGETAGCRLIKLRWVNPWSSPLNSLVSAEEAVTRGFWHSSNKSIYFYGSTLLFQALSLGLGSLCSDLV